MKMHLCKLILPVLFSLYAQTAQAGVDLGGNVLRVQLGADGKICFLIDSGEVTKYCKLSGLNLILRASRAPTIYVLLWNINDRTG
jgi:hypothetical protein